MTETTLYRCDNIECGKTTDDLYAPGWTRIESTGCSRIIVGNGRERDFTKKSGDGQAIITGYIDDATRLHFCSPRCLARHLERLQKEGYQKFLHSRETV